MSRLPRIAVLHTALFILVGLLGSASMAEDRICFCKVTDGFPECQSACAAPPKQDIKIVKVPAGGGGVTPIAMWQYDAPVVPPIGSKGGKTLEYGDALRSPEFRALIQKELDIRAEVVKELKRSADEEYKLGKMPDAKWRKAIKERDLDATSYEAWGAAIGAAEAREKLGWDFKAGKIK